VDMWFVFNYLWSSYEVVPFAKGTETGIGGVLRVTICLLTKLSPSRRGLKHRGGGPACAAPPAYEVVPFAKGTETRGQ
jgi:hypothetical protein